MHACIMDRLARMLGRESGVSVGFGGVGAQGHGARRMVYVTHRFGPDVEIAGKGKR
jgi:hypothetical protein